MVVAVELHVLALPDEILAHVFSFLDISHVVKCALVCSQFNQLATFDAVWQTLFEQRWGHSRLQSPHASSSHIYDKLTWNKRYERKSKTEKNWDLGAFEQITFDAHEAFVVRVAFMGDTMVSSSDDKTVKVWDIGTRELTHTLPHDGPVSCMTLNSRTGSLITGSDDGTIRSWNVQTGELLPTKYTHDDVVLCLDVKDDMLASGSCDKSMRVWDLTKGEKSGTFNQESYVTCVTILDSTHVLSSGNPISILWDLNENEETKRQAATFSYVDEIDVHIVRDGKLFVGAADHSITMWDLTKPDIPHEASPWLSFPACMDYSGGFLAAGITGDSCNSVIVVDPRQVDSWNWTSWSIKRKSVSSIKMKDNKIVFGLTQGMIAAIDTRVNNKFLFEVHRGNQMVGSVDFDDKYLVCGCDDGKVTVYNFSH